MSKRCVCQYPVQKQLDADTIACEACEGWIALRITTLEAWEKFQERFVVKKEPPCGSE